MKKTHSLKRKTLIQDLAPGDTFRLDDSDDLIKLDETEPVIPCRFLCASLWDGAIYRVAGTVVHPVNLVYCGV